MPRYIYDNPCKTYQSKNELCKPFAGEVRVYIKIRFDKELTRETTALPATYGDNKIIKFQPWVAKLPAKPDMFVVIIFIVQFIHNRR